MTTKRLLAALSISALLFAACGNDDPEITGQDVVDSAQEVGEDAADRTGDIAEQGGDVVEDATDELGDDSDTKLEIADSKVEGATAMLTMEVSGITIVAPDGDTSGNTGHFHVFIDRDPLAEGETIPKEDGIVHAATNPIEIPGLSPGEHTLTVVLGDGAHTRIRGEVEAEVTVTVA